MRRLTAVLLRPAVRISLASLDSRLRMIPRATDAPYATAVGPDPLHIAILGYGVGPGWGVATHALAMPGQLARALSHRLGHGVEVEVITEDTTLPSLIGLLEALDLSIFDAIVLSPGAYEAMSLMPVGEYKLLMEQAIARATRKDGTRPVVVLGVPPLDVAVNPATFLGSRVHARAEALDTVLADAISGSSVSFIPLAARAPMTDIREAAADRYRAWSEAVASALTQRLSSRDDIAESVTPLDRLTALMRSAFDAEAALVLDASGARVWVDARRSHRGIERSAAPELLAAAACSNGQVFDHPIGEHIAVAHPLLTEGGTLVGVSAVIHPDPASIDRRLLRNLGVLMSSELDGGRPVTVAR